MRHEHGLSRFALPARARTRAPLVAILCASLAAMPASCDRAGTFERADYLLGTLCRIAVPAGAPASAYDAAFAAAREVEYAMSANAEGTDIDRVNAAAGISAVAVSGATWLVVSKALEYAERSDGAFDPTVGPLVRLWRIGPEGGRVPSPEEIAGALAKIGWRRVAMDPATREIFLPERGMALDLGAIAKGFAADEAGRALREAGIRAAIVDFGGNILAVGAKADGSPWRIGVQDPFGPRGAYLGIVESRTGISLVSSGAYERFFVEDGRRYHHLLDTSTGRPCDNGLWQVTVAGTSSIDCDALSTAIFCLGPERGRALAEALTDFAVIMVDGDRRVWTNAAASAIFRITDPAFRPAED